MNHPASCRCRLCYGSRDERAMAALRYEQSRGLMAAAAAPGSPMELLEQAAALLAWCASTPPVEGAGAARQRLHEAELQEARHAVEAQVAAIAAADRAPPDHEHDAMTLATLAANAAEQHARALHRGAAVVV